MPTSPCHFAAAAAAGLAALFAPAGCATNERTPAYPAPDAHAAAPAQRPITWTRLAPGLRIALDQHMLEYDARVAIDCHDPVTPTVYLELVACTPDTREHESLVVSSVPPSLIHAGLLALSIQPGRPARIDPRDPSRRTPPAGESVLITVHTSEDDGPGEPITDWITDDTTGSRRPTGGWVFAGSQLKAFRGETVYDADLSGTVIGLATFGTETIAYGTVISPESAVDAPVWIADSRNVPARGTPVRVRIRPAE